MKALFNLIIVTAVLSLVSGCATPKPKLFKETYSSFDQPGDHPVDKGVPAGSFNFLGMQPNQVLDIYAGLANRTIIHGALPSASINYRTTTPVNRIEALQLLDTLMAENGITMVLMGEKAVKAVPASQAVSEVPPEIDLPWPLLPDSSSYMSRIVHLKHLKAAEVIPLLAPMAKLPNSITVVQSQNLLILRDYSANIKQQLRLLEELDQNSTR